MSTHDETWDRPTCPRCSQPITYGRQEWHAQGACVIAGLNLTLETPPEEVALPVRLSLQEAEDIADALLAGCLYLGTSQKSDAPQSLDATSRENTYHALRSAMVALENIINGRIPPLRLGKRLPLS